MATLCLEKRRLENGLRASECQQDCWKNLRSSSLVAYDMGIDRLLRMDGELAATLHRPGEERSCNMPTREWKQKRFKKTVSGTIWLVSAATDGDHPDVRRNRWILINDGTGSADEHADANKAGYNRAERPSAISVPHELGEDGMYSYNLTAYNIFRTVRTGERYLPVVLSEANNLLRTKLAERR